jgi:hypothetical protein
LRASVGSTEADKGVLARVDRDHGSPAFLERLHLGVEMLELRVAVRTAYHDRVKFG